MGRYQNFATQFKQAIDTHAKGINQVELAELLGTSQSIISRVNSGSKLPSDSVVDKMYALWGVDLRNELRQIRDEERYKPTKKDIPNIPVHSGNKGIPYFDVDFVGGFDMIINDQTVVPSYFIDFKPYDRATCWCNITGHSMEPEISHGDIIALRKIEDTSYLPFGEIYAIVTKNDMRTVKRIGPGPTKDTYMLIPANKSPEYAPQEILKSDILHLYEVMGCMKRF